MGGRVAEGAESELYGEVAATGGLTAGTPLVTVSLGSSLWWQDSEWTGGEGDPQGALGAGVEARAGESQN